MQAGTAPRPIGKGIYTAEVKTFGGRKLAVVGSFNDCVAFVHGLGNKVKKAEIKAAG